jgi:hypothetical protein
MEVHVHVHVLYCIFYGNNACYCAYNIYTLVQIVTKVQSTVRVQHLCCFIIINNNIIIIIVRVHACTSS